MAKRRGGLTREAITEAAMSLLDADGVPAFTMRRLAAALGVDPMAIYHHVPGKQALFHDVVERLLQAWQLPEQGGSWQAQVTGLCQAFRSLGHAHPGAFMVYAVHEQWPVHELDVHELLYRTLHDAGFDKAATVQAARLLLAYAENFVWYKLTGWTGPHTKEERTALSAALDDGTHPMTAAHYDAIVGTDGDAEFAFGLDVLIRGLEARAAAAKP